MNDFIGFERSDINPLHVALFPDTSFSVKATPLLSLILPKLGWGGVVDENYTTIGLPVGSAEQRSRSL
jgi:hypothetical protein